MVRLRPLVATDSLRSKALDVAKARSRSGASLMPEPTPPEQVGLGLGGRQPAAPPLISAPSPPIAAAARRNGGGGGGGGESKFSAYRGNDAWEYEKVSFPGRTLKGGPPMQTGGPRKEPTQRFSVVGRAEVRLGALNGVYGRLSHPEPQQPQRSMSRVQSLPSIPSSRAANLHADHPQVPNMHGSPHRFLVHQGR